MTSDPPPLKKLSGCEQFGKVAKIALGDDRPLRPLPVAAPMVFLLNPEKVVADPSCYFREKRKKHTL